MVFSGLVNKAVLFSLGLAFVSVNASISSYQFCRSHCGERRTVAVHYLSPEDADRHGADLTATQKFIEVYGNSKNIRIIGIFDVRKPDEARPEYDRFMSDFLTQWMMHDLGALEQYSDVVEDGSVAVREACMPRTIKSTAKNIVTMLNAREIPFAFCMNDVFYNACESENPFGSGLDLWYQKDITLVIFTNYVPETFIPFFTVDRSIDRKLRPFYYWYTGCTLMPR